MTDPKALAEKIRDIVDECRPTSGLDWHGLIPLIESLLREATQKSIDELQSHGWQRKAVREAKAAAYADAAKIADQYGNAGDAIRSRASEVCKP